jgi:hypothetical protein
MRNLDKALAWSALGQSVLPCHARDHWDGPHLRKAKTPIISNGVSGASCESEKIRKWFEELYPDALVGVKAGTTLNVADIDIDVESNLDGNFELEKRGLLLPSTFMVTTPRGGQHHYYLPSSNQILGPMAPIRDFDGKEIPGVDRRAGESYFISWSEEVPESLSQLGLAPDWLSIPSRKGESPMGYSKGLDQWLREIPDGYPTEEVLRAALEIPSEPFGHTKMISLQRRLVGLAASGHTGVARALAELRQTWLTGEFDTNHYRRDWIGSLEGAVAKFGNLNKNKATPDSDEAFEGEVEAAIRKKRIEREAQQRLFLSETSTTEEISWDELGSSNHDYLVQDLIPKGGIVFIAAKPNLGKTLAYVDMVCKAATGNTWLGKDTRPFKTMIVVSEGLSGLQKRFESWCQYHGIDLDAIKPWIVFARGVNLSNRRSLVKLKEIVDRHAPELIIFDTYSGTSGVTDEDDAGPATQVLREVKEISDDATVLFVHHPNKATEKTQAPVMRGTSVLHASADVVMTIYEEKDKRPDKDAHKLLALSTEGNHAGKNRDSNNETIRGIYIDGSKTEVPVFSWSKDLFRNPRANKIRGLLALNPMTVLQVANVLGVSAKTADRYIKDAIDAGLIVKIPSKAANKPHLYKPAKNDDRPDSSAA